MPRGNPGVPKSDEQRAKQSAAMAGRSHSPESREKMSASGRGRPKSREHREAISKALAGRTKTDEINYYVVHARMGRASEHTCTCGRQAQDWAYQYTCPQPRFSAEGWPYSEDPSDYLPMCRRCHKKLDANR